MIAYPIANLPATGQGPKKHINKKTTSVWNPMTLSFAN